MKTLIETQYFSPIPVFSQIALNDTGIIVEQFEHYQKRSFRNKCTIATANGLQVLTIPLVSGKNAQQLIRDVKISDEDRWQAIHWQAIRSAYGKSPFFEYYSDYFEPLYAKKQVFLFDFNFELLNLVLKLLKMEIPVECSTAYYKSHDSAGDVVDCRNQFSKITTETVAKKYPQVFEDRHGFIPFLSIIDLLFCMGPNSKLYF
ncbi:MAG: WbqC family protein [Saprospiraceae bacterium]